MRIQLQQQSQIQQQMFIFFSRCFGQLYRHTGPVCLSLNSLHPSSSSLTPLFLLHLLEALCRHPWCLSRCHLIFRLGCLPAQLLLLLLLLSRVSGQPSSVQSSLGSSRFCISFSTCQLSRSLSSHLLSLRCSVRLLFAPLSQTRLPSRLLLRQTPRSSCPSQLLPLLQLLLLLRRLRSRRSPLRLTKTGRTTTSTTPPLSSPPDRA